MWTKKPTAKKTQQPADVERVATAVNKACRAKGGVYAGYSCKYVSWDDVSRGQVGGNLSCWGPNITDTYLKARGGKRLFTVRSDNWNEKLGYVSSDKVAVVVGNTAQPPSAELRPVTLRSFLKNIGQYGQYANLSDDVNLSDEALDDKVSIRFQTTFLPVAEQTKPATRGNDDDGADGDSHKRGTLEFCTEAYNYNTRSDSDPRNLVVLATTQGVAIQQDGQGTKKLMHHSISASGDITRHWLEAERSDHKVGGQQQETDEEREDAAKRGKATAAVIGIPAMGTRFNALLTIQIPLQQQKRPTRRQAPGFFLSDSDDCESENGIATDCFSFNGAPTMLTMKCSMPSSSGVMYKKCKKKESAPRCRRSCSRGGSRGMRVGRANAARVSKGSSAGKYSGLSITNPVRDAAQHITVTVVFYNTVVGGVPSQADVVAAIDDMEALYKACHWRGRLADQGADFMKQELTVKDCVDISTKLAQQPQVNKSLPVANYNIFPQD